MKDPTPMERLEKLARAIVGVPKAEVDKKARRYAKKRKGKTTSQLRKRGS